MVRSSNEAALLRSPGNMLSSFTNWKSNHNPIFSSFQASELLAFIEDMSEILTLLLTRSGIKSDASSILAQSLLHDLVFTGESKKSCLHKKPENDPALDLDGVERWMVMNAPLFDKIMQHGLARSFGLALEPSLVPTTEINLGDKSNTRLRPLEVVFLNSALPHEFRSQWRLLFNSRYYFFKDF